MQDFEKLGLFYLGKAYDIKERKVTSELVLYESKDLTTHAVCMGMTGSGKTGLGIALLEEAAIDGIPVIAVDPKGDLGNLLLGFPELRAQDFLPWIDWDDAARKGLSSEEFAEKTAETWRAGLAAWGEDGERIARFREAVDLAIYTPGSDAGLPLTVLRSFDAPPDAIASQPEAYRERIGSTVSGLLALLNVDADPMSSREHILLSNIVDHAWREGADLDISGLIHGVQSPPFQRVGVLDLEAFYPAKLRFALAMKLNNLLASPGFAAWMTGEPLDVDGLLSTRQGKPRLSVISIAHLSDSERMFFVTILLNEVLTWARSQPGTSSLRAILYMDEIFGYFPSTANPPSKPPMLTLLKQARAYGLGIVLATQNPIDLDYKGLSNAGTWFLGRLQTQRDKDRVLDGLEGASTASGHAFDRPEMDKVLSALGQRVFVMNNVHDDQPVVFQTRWTLSYLRGPLTREQIQTLMATRKQRAAVKPVLASPEVSSLPETATLTAAHAAAPKRAVGSTGPSVGRPVVPPDVPQFFVPCRVEIGAGGLLEYRPGILGVTRLHYADKKAGVDHWETVALLQPVAEQMPADIWTTAVAFDDGVPELDKSPATGARFASMPGELARAKSYGEWNKGLKNFLYRERTLAIWGCPSLKEWSRPDESERSFRLRLSQATREQRDKEVEKLRAKYGPKMAAIQQQIARTRERMARAEADASRSTWDATVAVGSSVLGALLGRKALSQTNVTKATSAAKAAGRATQKRGDVEQAAESLDTLHQKYTALELEFRGEVEELVAALRPEAVALERVLLRPKKADITVEQVVLAWTPWAVNADGTVTAAY